MSGPVVLPTVLHAILGTEDHATNMSFFINAIEYLNLNVHFSLSGSDPLLLFLEGLSASSVPYLYTSSWFVRWIQTGAWVYKDRFRVINHQSL